MENLFNTAFLETLSNATKSFLWLGLELSFLFVFVSFLVALMQKYVNQEALQRAMSKKFGYIFAILLASLTPFCSCSTIPILRGFVKAKVGFGEMMSFLFLSPLINPFIIGLLIVTFSLKFTLIYVLIAIFVAVFASILLNLFGFQRFIKQEKSFTSANPCCETTKNNLLKIKMQDSCYKENLCCESTKIPNFIKFSSQNSSDNGTKFTLNSCCTPKQNSCCENPLDSTQNSPQNLKPNLSKNLQQNLKANAKFALKEAFLNFKQVFPYLLLGVSIGAFLHGFVPSEFITKYAGSDNILAIPIAAIVGIPLYVRMETLIPLSSALLAKGMSLGSLFSFIVGSSGASITELILLKSMFKIQLIVAFLGVVFFMAIFVGFVFQICYN